MRYELYGLVSAELGGAFDLQNMLTFGYLPRHLLERSRPMLRSYVDDYLKEEILAEGLVRRLAPFSKFLTAAALTDGEFVNYTNIASDCGVSAPTVREYFQILEDTLLARFLPAHTRRPKRRVILSPKFYFADVGVTNVLARRKEVSAGTSSFGKAFENWIFHELSACRAYTGGDWDLSYWRLPSGIEVDFVSEELGLAIEAKASPRIGNHHLKPLRELRKEFGWAKRCEVVCLEPRRRTTEDGIEIVPYSDFAKGLWQGAYGE